MGPVSQREASAGPTLMLMSVIGSIPREVRSPPWSAAPGTASSSNLFGTYNQTEWTRWPFQRGTPCPTALTCGCRSVSSPCSRGRHADNSEEGRSSSQAPQRHRRRSAAHPGAGLARAGRRPTRGNRWTGAPPSAAAASGRAMSRPTLSIQFARNSGPQAEL